MREQTSTLVGLKRAIAIVTYHDEQNTSSIVVVRSGRVTRYFGFDGNAYRTKNAWTRFDADFLAAWRDKGAVRSCGDDSHFLWMYCTVYIYICMYVYVQPYRADYL
jgi:hypothetical protein